jgi:hypothetical protein
MKRRRPAQALQRKPGKASKLNTLENSLGENGSVVLQAGSAALATLTMVANF